MQGNDNFVRIFKKNEGTVSKDRKRSKDRPKDERKKLRKLKLKEMTDE
jgi:hypothetical protein